jgi:hypothetical protein
LIKVVIRCFRRFWWWWNGVVSPGGTATNGTTNTGLVVELEINSPSSGAGGSGVVILRFPTADYSGTTTGSPTVSTDGTDTILTFTQVGVTQDNGTFCKNRNR